MSSRRRRDPKSWSRESSLDVWGDPYVNGYSTLTVPVYLPRPVALRARREVYTYPYPSQRRLKARTIRLRLRRSHAPLVYTKVRIKMPRRLPLARGSYVSITDKWLNIHSRKQHAKALSRYELNRRRYTEGKSNRRKGRHGQLDSPGADAFGSVAEAARRGLGVNRLADAAMVARAILHGRF